MSMDARVRDLAMRTATECKAIRTMINGNAAALDGLIMPPRSTIVETINAVQARIDALLLELHVIIDDAQIAALKTWSSSKITTELQNVKDDITNGASSTMSAIAEINRALSDETNAISSISTALANRLRVDAAQTLTPTQQTQARANLGAVASVDVGSTDTDYVAIFNTGLLS